MDRDRASQDLQFKTKLSRTKSELAAPIQVPEAKGGFRMAPVPGRLIHTTCSVAFWLISTPISLSAQFYSNNLLGYPSI
jgi:hypothetical protein